jgi:Fe-S cluster assembly protein SufD
LSTAAVKNTPPPAMSSFERQWHARGGEALHGAREEAMNRFLRLGLPTLRDESWRYTNLHGLGVLDFVQAVAPAGTPAAVRSWLDPVGRLPTLLLVNGSLVAPRPGQFPEIEGVDFQLLRNMPREEWLGIAERFPPFSDAERHRWALLNMALFTDGIHIRIGAEVAAPLLVLQVTVGGQPNAAAHPLLLIEASAGARATVVEHHVQARAEPHTAHGGYATLCNSVTRVALDAGARLDHYRVFSTGADATHFDTLEVRQARDSRCTEFTVALGGGLVRTTLESSLAESGAALESYALLVGHESRHVDCVNLAVHAAPRTVSRQTARAIASGESRVIFNSTVRVAAGARQSESQQSCRGLLLSAQAEIDSRPQLEIHTDEVKCAHGATTGRLDPDMLFYLLSRGLDRDTAQSLLVYAFLADVLANVPLGEARAAIENTLISQLPDSQVLRNFR